MNVLGWLSLRNFLKYEAVVRNQFMTRKCFSASRHPQSSYVREQIRILGYPDSSDLAFRLESFLSRGLPIEAMKETRLSDAVLREFTWRDGNRNELPSEDGMFDVLLGTGFSVQQVWEMYQGCPKLFTQDPYVLDGVMHLLGSEVRGLDLITFFYSYPLLLTLPYQHWEQRLNDLGPYFPINSLAKVFKAAPNLLVGSWEERHRPLFEFLEQRIGFTLDSPIHRNYTMLTVPYEDCRCRFIFAERAGYPPSFDLSGSNEEFLQRVGLSSDEYDTFRSLLALQDAEDDEIEAEKEAEAHSNRYENEQWREKSKKRAQRVLEKRRIAFQKKKDPGYADYK